MLCTELVALRILIGIYTFVISATSSSDSDMWFLKWFVCAPCLFLLQDSRIETPLHVLEDVLHWPARELTYLDHAWYSSATEMSASIGY